MMKWFLRFRSLGFFGVSAVLAGCGGIHDAVDNANRYMPQIGDLKSNTAETNEYLKALKAGVHDQTLAQTLALMLASDNAQYFPLPTPFMVAAEKFSAVATPDELVKLATTWLLQVNAWKVGEVESALSDYQNTASDIDAEIAALGEDKAEEIQLLQEKRKSLHDALANRLEGYNLKKNVTLMALRVIAGLMPQANTQRLYQEQLAGGRGRFRPAAKALLALRADFLKTYLLFGQRFQAGAIDNGDSLEETVYLANGLTFLATLPEAKYIGIRTTGIFETDPDVAKPDEPSKENLNDPLSKFASPAILKQVWKKVGEAATVVASDGQQPRDQHAKILGLTPLIQRQLQLWSK